MESLSEGCHVGMLCLCLSSEDSDVQTQKIKEKR